MAVTGWSNNGLRTWGSTTGDETGAISCDNGTFAVPGMLTRTANDGIVDFEFTTNIVTTSYGNADYGGITFCVNSGDYTKNYTLTWVVNSWESKYGGAATKFFFRKNCTNGDRDSGTEVSVGYKNSIATTFTLKVVKSGNSFSFYVGGVLLDATIGTANWTVSDATHNSGNIGYCYPADQWTGNSTRFTFVSIVNTAASKRKILIIS